MAHTGRGNLGPGPFSGLGSGVCGGAAAVSERAVRRPSTELVEPRGASWRADQASRWVAEPLLGCRAVPSTVGPWARGRIGRALNRLGRMNTKDSELTLFFFRSIF